MAAAAPDQRLVRLDRVESDLLVAAQTVDWGDGSAEERKRRYLDWVQSLGPIEIRKDTPGNVWDFNRDTVSAATSAMKRLVTSADSRDLIIAARGLAGELMQLVTQVQSAYATRPSPFEGGRDRIVTAYQPVTIVHASSILMIGLMGMSLGAAPVTAAAIGVLGYALIRGLAGALPMQEGHELSHILQYQITTLIYDAVQDPRYLDQMYLRYADEAPLLRIDDTPPGPGQIQEIIRTLASRYREDLIRMADEPADLMPESGARLSLDGIRQWAESSSSFDWIIAGAIAGAAAALLARFYLETIRSAATALREHFYPTDEMALLARMNLPDISTDAPWTKPFGELWVSLYSVAIDQPELDPGNRKALRKMLDNVLLLHPLLINSEKLDEWRNISPLLLELKGALTDLRRGRPNAARWSTQSKALLHRAHISVDHLLMLMDHPFGARMAETKPEQDRQAMALLKQQLAGLDPAVIHRLRPIRDIGELRASLLAEGVSAADRLRGKFLFDAWQGWIGQLDPEQAPAGRVTHLRYEGNGRHLIAYSAEGFPYVLKMNQDPGLKRFVRLEWIENGLWLARERLGGLAAPTMAIDTESNPGQKPLVYLLERAGEQTADVAIVQKKVVPLIDHLKELVRSDRLEEAKRRMDEYKRLTMDMFRRGVVDTDFGGILANYGVDEENGKLVVFDFGDLAGGITNAYELTDFLENATNAYIESGLRGEVDDELADYFRENAFTAADFTRDGQYLFETDLSVLSPEELRMDFPLNEQEVREFFSHHRIADRSSAARMAADLHKLTIDPAEKEPAAAAIEAFRAMMGGSTIWLDWSKWPAASTQEDYEMIADWIRAFSGELASQFWDDAKLKIMLDGGSPVVSHYRLYLFIREMLKNAFVHGNALRQDLPIALKADLRETSEGPILSGIQVHDTAQPIPASRRLMRAAKGPLWGYASGVSKILTPDAEETGRWSYERVPVKDGAAPIAQAAVIHLTEKFWPLMPGARMALEARGRDRIGKVYSSTSSLVRRLSAFLDAEGTPARRRLARQFPEVEAYFAQSPEVMNYDGQAVSAGRERNASLYHHVVVRGLGQKLAGLESGDIGLFQGAGTPEDRGIRADRFERLTELTRRLRDAGVLPHLRAAFLHHEAAKGGSSAQRAVWRSIPGMDLRIPNRASGLILRNIKVPGVEAKGFFENIGYLDRAPNAAVLHEFFYRVIENRGSAGQWVRGELSYAAFEDLTVWIRGNFGRLSEAVGAAGNADEAARRISGILHLFEVLDVASLREGLYAEPLAAEMEEVFVDWAAVITPKDGKFGTNWSDLFEARWGGLRSDEDRRTYLKDRLGRFRRERRAAGESQEDLDRVLSAPALSAAAAERFTTDLRNFQGWYPESAAYGLSPEAMVKLIALAIAHAERAGVDTDRPYHLHFFEFMKFLSSGRHQFDPYKVRIVETLLKGFDLNLILTNPKAALSSGAQEGQESPLGAVRMDLSGQKAISFEFHMSDEAEALLRLIRIYELKSGPKYHQALKMLLDLYGLRRDEFDRVANETVYLQGMRAAASDKARLLSHGKGPVWVDIGPADGATLEIAESLKAQKGLERIVGVEISEEAFRHLQGVIRSKGLSAEAVRGDAGRLKEVLWMAGVPEPDTIIFSSVLHEVFSYAAPYGGRYDLESVKDVLRAAILALAPGGRILIRDGVVPEDGDKDQVLEITGRESKEVFDYFVQNFEARERYFEGSARPTWKDNFTIVEEDAQRQFWKVRMPRKAAMEFLFKLSWAFKPEYDASGLPSEIREQYGVMKRSEYLRVIDELAGELGMSVREVELPDAERAYLQQGYVDTLKGKAQLFDLDGSPAPFGPSNMMIVVEKSVAARMAAEPLIDLKYRTAKSDPALVANVLERVRVFRGLKPAVPADTLTEEDGRSALRAIFVERFGEGLAAPMSPYERELFEFFVSRPEIPMHFHADEFGPRDLGSFSYQDENGHRRRGPGVGIYEPGAERVSWVLGSQHADVLTPEASYRMMLHEMSHVYDGMNEIASIDARIASGDLDEREVYGPYTGYLGLSRGFQGGPAIQHRLSYREFKANLWSMGGDVEAAYQCTLQSYPNLMEQTIQPLLDLDPAYPRDEIYLIFKRLSEDPASNRHLNMDRDEDLELLSSAAAQARRELGRPERTPRAPAAARMAGDSPAPEIVDLLGEHRPASTRMEHVGDRVIKADRGSGRSATALALELIDNAAPGKLKADSAVLLVGGTLGEFREVRKRYPQSRVAILNTDRAELQSVVQAYASGEGVPVGSMPELYLADVSHWNSRAIANEGDFDLVYAGGLDQTAFASNPELVGTIQNMIAQELEWVKDDGIIYHPADGFWQGFVDAGIVRPVIAGDTDRFVQTGIFVKMPSAARMAKDSKPRKTKTASTGRNLKLIEVQQEGSLAQTHISKPGAKVLLPDGTTVTDSVIMYLDALNIEPKKILLTGGTLEELITFMRRYPEAEVHVINSDPGVLKEIMDSKNPLLSRSNAPIALYLADASKPVPQIKSGTYDLIYAGGLD
ncbi:MAG: hypothetical protein KBD07_03085, partial [Candidatus Omnitrophica bacterium]|nr:hypothetical protein [Candidatus Omnitrophota bacterium]